jgi:hypothetical protein
MNNEYERIGKETVLNPEFSEYDVGVLLEKLIVTQQIKKMPAFYGARNFITVFRRSLCGPYPESDVSILHLNTLFS